MYATSWLCCLICLLPDLVIFLYLVWVPRKLSKNLITQAPLASGCSVDLANQRYQLNNGGGKGAIHYPPPSPSPHPTAMYCHNSDSSFILLWPQLFGGDWPSMMLALNLVLAIPQAWGSKACCCSQLMPVCVCECVCVCACLYLSHVQPFVIPWTVAHQALLAMEFSRQKYWSGLPFPSPADLPDPGIEPGSSVLQVDSLHQANAWLLPCALSNSLNSAHISVDDLFITKLLQKSDECAVCFLPGGAEFTVYDPGSHIRTHTEEGPTLGFMHCCILSWNPIPKTFEEEALHFPFYWAP